MLLLPGVSGYKSEMQKIVASATVATTTTTNAENIIHSNGNFLFGFVYLCIEESRNVAVSFSQHKMMYAQFVYAILACMACI